MARIKQVRLRATANSDLIRKQAGIPITQIWWAEDGSVIFVPRDGLAKEIDIATIFQRRMTMKFPGCQVKTVPNTVMPGCYDVQVTIPA